MSVSQVLQVFAESGRMSKIMKIQDVAFKNIGSPINVISNTII